jgi:hypothetical protein
MGYLRAQREGGGVRCSQPLDCVRTDVKGISGKPAGGQGLRMRRASLCSFISEEAAPGVLSAWALGLKKHRERGVASFVPGTVGMCSR